MTKTYKTINFFIDDSGQLKRNEKNKYFVYAGYYFLDEKEQNKFKNSFSNLEKSFAKKYEKFQKKEIKASSLKPKNKAKFFNIGSSLNRIGIFTNIENVEKNPLKEKGEIGRFKDFLIKRLVRFTLEKLIDKKEISKNEHIKLILNIDNQSTDSNGYYSLKNLIKEDLLGNSNYNFNEGHH